MDSILENLYSTIPKNLDILITHDAPFGVSDIILQKDCPWYDGKTHIGNKPLSRAILKQHLQIFPSKEYLEQILVADLPSREWQKASTKYMR